MSGFPVLGVIIWPSNSSLAFLSIRSLSAPIFPATRPFTSCWNGYVKGPWVPMPTPPVFMTVLAALDVVLTRWSGQEELCVGVPSAGRNHVAIEPLIGFFINTLVIRTDLSGNPTFHELLERVREGALGAYAHQALPFEKLVEELQPVRDPSRTPFFQVFVNMVPPKEEDVQFLGLTVEPLLGNEPQAKFDLTVYLQERPEGLGVNLVYNADLFLPDRMQHLLAQFQGLLEQIVAAPDQPLSRYSLCTQQEPHLQPFQWQLIIGEIMHVSSLSEHA